MLWLGILSPFLPNPRGRETESGADISPLNRFAYHLNNHTELSLTSDECMGNLWEYPMAEVEFKLSGWQAAVAIVVIVGVLIGRVVSFGDASGDSELMKKLDLELTTEYFPGDVDRLRGTLDTGDRDEISRTAKSVATTKLTIKSVRTSYPLFNFDANRNVIVRVDYSLDDGFDNREEGTKYYRFIHKSMVNVWEYRSQTSAAFYYLNFI